MESAIVPVGYHMVRQRAVIILNGERGLQPVHVTQDALNDINPHRSAMRNVWRNSSTCLQR